MSGLIRRRWPWRRVTVTVLVLVCVGVLGATLAAALQIREVRVEGPRRFPVAEVEKRLHAALGSMTLTVRATDLRDVVCELPWVEDATVRVTLDGTVHCQVREREPVACTRDGELLALVDARGHLLGPATGTTPGLELVGFAPHPTERVAVLAALPALAQTWGLDPVRVDRVGPRDVALWFPGVPCAVLVDPLQPAQLLLARRVLEAWLGAGEAAPQRLDARIANRVAVLAAPAPTEDPA